MNLMCIDCLKTIHLQQKFCQHFCSLRNYSKGLICTTFLSNSVMFTT